MALGIPLELVRRSTSLFLFLLLLVCTTTTTTAASLAPSLAAAFRVDERANLVRCAKNTRSCSEQPAKWQLAAGKCCRYQSLAPPAASSYTGANTRDCSVQCAPHRLAPAGPEERTGGAGAVCAASCTEAQRPAAATVGARPRALSVRRSNVACTHTKCALFSLFPPCALSLHILLFSPCLSLLALLPVACLPACLPACPLACLLACLLVS